MQHLSTTIAAIIKRRSRAILALVATAVALAAYGVVGPGPAGDILFVGISMGASTAVFVGVRRRPVVHRAWFAIGLTLALLTGANLLAAAARYDAMSWVRPFVEVLYMSAYFPLFVAAFRFGRGMHRADRTTFLDTGIIVVAAVPLIWELVVEPRVPAGTAEAATTMALALPVVAIILVSLAAPLLYVRASRSASAFLFVGGLATMGIGDSLYGLQTIAGSGSPSTLVNLAWLASYILLGASALVPSARQLGATREPNPAQRDLGRLTVLAAAMLVGPLVTMHETVGAANQDLVVYAVLALIGASLLILRLQRTLGQLHAADHRFRSFMSHDQFMAVIKDSAGRYIYMNPSAEAVRRQAGTEWYGRTDSQLFDPAVAAERTEADAAIRRDGNRLVRQVEQDGRIWHTERFALAGRRGDIGVLGVDISEHVRAEEAVRAQALELARLGAAIDNATDAVMVTDRDDRVVYVNPAFERLTGFTADEVTGHLPSDSPGGEPFARALAQAAASRSGWRGDIASWRRDGSDLISETSISPIAIDGASAGFVTIAHDVTRERAAAHIADRRARERTLIAETLGALHAGVAPEATARSVCEQLIKLPEVAIASVVMFANDGAAAVLEQADRDGTGTSNVALPADRSAYLRSRAIAGPWVERWTVGPSHPYFERFAELEIMAHAYAPIVVDGEPIGLLITGSDWVDAVDRMAERLPALIEFAAITSTLMGDAVVDRMAVAKLAAEMHEIIAAGEFHPVFQPIVNLATGKVLGYEALTRFADGTPPDVRFEHAHRLGAGVALEAACLAAIFEAAEHLPRGPWLNVNVSPEVVLTGLLERILPADGREVVLEITEHQAISDYASFRAAIDPIRDRVKLAVDDAGAGFASLRHIVELAPEMVKLDRSLIAGIDTDPAREAVAAGMVRFAQAAGLALLAEGIETREELATLRQLGVELGQGYLLGRPTTISNAVLESMTSDVAASIAARQRRGRGAPAAAPETHGSTVAPVPAGRTLVLVGADA